MASSPSISGIIGNSVGEAAAFAAGVAVGPLLEPILQALRNTTWSQYPDRPLDPHDLAALVAETILDETTAAPEAALTGIAPTPFSRLVDLARVAPGEGTLIRLLQRQSEQAVDIDHGLAKSHLEAQWWDAVKNLANSRISATDLAYMMVRGVLPDDGLLGMSLPTQPDNLKLPPQYALDPVAEAALTGWNRERLGAMVARSGLAMAPVMAAQAYFRGHLTDNDYLLTIARGDLFPAYADVVRNTARAIPTPLDGTEGHLRGWLTQAQMYDVTARHGMTKADTDLLYSIRRRPLSPHQIKQALARGGTFDAAQAPFADPYTASVHEANLGPEWYDLAVHLAGAYPSIFQTNRLVTGGTISATDGISWLHKSGMADEVVTAMEAAWTKPGSAAADKDVASAATKLKTRVHSSYVAAEIDDATATTALTAAGVPAASIPKILSLYAEERSLVRKQLTPTQIRKAVSGAIVNPATGQPWTQAEALAALEARGYSAADAQTFMAE